VNQELVIDNVTYRVAEHLAAPGMPYGQEGRQATVYQLAAPSPAVGEGQEGSPDRRALKVFKPRYRLPALAGLADKLASFAVLRGLAVCHRTVLTARRHADLLHQHPDLIYAVLMPWIEGPTWMEVLLQRQALAPEQSLALARSLAEILAGMEEHGLAHCDLSGPNVLLPALLPSPSIGRGVGGEGGVALVDVEQLYGPDLRRPELLPGGSPGYAHKTAPDGLWSSTADRFAGAVLLGEMLGWCDERVREASWGENYFDPHEMQRESERFQALVGVLEERWGTGVARLFERAWRSEVLADCATFGEWLVMLPEEVPTLEAPSVGVTTEEPRPGQREAVEDALRVLVDLGRQFEEQGQLESALQTYRRACELAPAGSGLAEELALIVQGLEAKQKEAIAPELQSVPMEKVVEAVTPVLLPVEEAKAEVMPTQPQSLPEEGTDTETIAPTPETALERELALIAQEVGAKPQEEAPSLELQPLVVEAEAEVTTPPADEETDLDRLFDDGLAAYERGEWAKARELLSEVVRQRPTYERHGKQVKSLLAEVEAHLAPLRQRKAIVWAWALGGLAVVVLGFLLLGGSRLITAWLSSSRATPIVVEVAVEVTSTPRPPVAPGPTATPESMPGTVSVSAVVPKPVTIRPDESAQVTYRFVNNTGVRVHIFSHKWFWTTTYGRKIEGHDGQEGYPDFSIPAGQSVSWVDEVYLPCEIVRQVANWGVESVIIPTTIVGTD
jgi:tetratricopeptide (TPR) repeat protein